MTTYSFNVGDRFENRKGPYEVISVDGPYMVIRWDNGEEIRTDVKGQAKVLRNMQLEIETPKQKRRSTPAWFGESFAGLQEHEFGQDVTGTHWRAREMLGGLVTHSIEAQGLQLNSWSIYKRPEVQIADVVAYGRYEAHFQAKLFLAMMHGDLWAGLLIERSNNLVEPRHDWNAFVQWISTHEADLRAVVEQHGLSIFDPYATWTGVFKGIVTANDGQWLYQREEQGHPVLLASLSEVLHSLDNNQWLNFIIAHGYPKHYAIERGRAIGTEIGSMLNALVPAYRGSIMDGRNVMIS